MVGTDANAMADSTLFSLEDKPQPLKLTKTGYMRAEQIGYDWQLILDSLHDTPEGVRNDDWFGEDDRVMRVTITAEEHYEGANP